MLCDPHQQDGEQRILMFASDDSLELLQESESWFCDGTFKTVPKLFAQLYTVHAKHHGHIIPVLYALLPNKQEETYTRMLTALSEVCPELAPTTITTDFEQAAINAFQGKFPEARLQG